MSKKADITKEAQEYCEKRGIALSSLGLLALNNPRWFERHERRRTSTEDAAAKLRAYMAENPAEDGVE